MSWRWLEPEETDWKVLLGITVVSAVLFILSFVSPVRVRIVVENVGDVSNIVGSIWTTATGLATFLSLALAIQSRSNERDTSSEDGLETDVLIKTGGGDVYLDGMMDEDQEIRAQGSDEASSSDDEETEPEEPMTQ